MSCAVQQHLGVGGGVWAHLHTQCVLCQRSAMVGRAALLLRRSGRWAAEAGQCSLQFPLLSARGEFWNIGVQCDLRSGVRGCIFSWVDARRTSS